MTYPECGDYGPDDLASDAMNEATRLLWDNEHYAEHACGSGSPSDDIEIAHHCGLDTAKIKTDALAYIEEHTEYADWFREDARKAVDGFFEDANLEEEKGSTR